MYDLPLEPAKSLTREQYEKILKMIIKEKRKDWISDLALVMTTEYCGLRSCEIGLLKKIYYDRRNHTIFCPRAKNSNSNTLKILDPCLLKILDYYLENNEKVKNSEYIFPGATGNGCSRDYASDHFMWYVDHADFFLPEYTTIHTLKHTRGQYLADMGLDIKEVQYWLGHKSVRNTLIYFQFSKIQQDNMYRKVKKLASSKNDYLHIENMLETL